MSFAQNLCLLAILTFSFAPPSTAPAQNPPPTPAARLAKLRADYAVDFKAVNKPVLDANGQFDHYETIGTISPEKYLPALLDLGKSSDEDTAVAALTDAVCLWATDNHSEEALSLLLKRFGASPKLALFAQSQWSRSYPGQEKHLARLVDEAKDPASVCMSLLKLGMLHDDNSFPYAFRKLTPHQAKQEEAIALEYYRRVVAEYPQQDEGRGAAKARLCITQIQRMRKGLPAPAISALDVTGQPMTLAEFRGKMVVIDFWGSWCGPCLRKLSMMKEVAAQYAAKDVVFLGVMAEEKAEDARNAIKKHVVPWRNWLDLRNKQDTSRIVTDWGVASFPSVYVLDRAGTIRFTRVLERDELERALDSLLAEKTSVKQP